jgi:hypothetical protein
MPYWVGITGGSASGKTFLLQALQKALPENLVTSFPPTTTTRIGTGFRPTQTDVSTLTPPLP